MHTTLEGIFWDLTKNHPNISKSFKRNLFQFRTAAMRSLLPSLKCRLLEPIRELIRHRVFHGDTLLLYLSGHCFFFPHDSWSISGIISKKKRKKSEFCWWQRRVAAAATHRLLGCQISHIQWRCRWFGDLLTQPTSNFANYYNKLVPWLFANICLEGHDPIPLWDDMMKIILHPFGFVLGVIGLKAKVAEDHTRLDSSWSLRCQLPQAPA